MITQNRTKIFSLLLALVLVLSLFPTAAFAAELPNEPTDELVCTDENCALEHEHEEEHFHDEECGDCPEVNPAPNTYEEKLASMEETEESAEPGELEWMLDPDGVLHIGGTGAISPFSSAEDQPWWYQREQISAVMFDRPNQPVIENMEYWFEGCTNLDPENIFDPEMCEMLGGISLMSFSDCGILECTCTGYCSWYGRNPRTAENPDRYHIVTVCCTGCGKTGGVIITESHSFSGNTCTECGYTKACSHPSTRTEYYTSCDWERYCTSCGEVLSYGTTHGPYTYSSWKYYNTTSHRRTYTCSYGDSGTYSETERHSTTTSYSQYSATQHKVSSYCATCSSNVGSASYANHNFTYGSWTNYSSTQHRRTKSCSTCGYSEYEYTSHSLSYGAWTKTSTQHSRTISCSCGYSTIESGGHSYTYGAWSSYNDSQHRRTKICSVCGYSEYEYANHSMSSGTWASVSDTQHRRTNTCSCGYSKTETEAHSFTYGSLENYSSTQHRKSKTCACGYIGSDYSPHTLVNGEWSSVSESQHKRVNACACGHSVDETGDHADADNNGYCDECSYLMTRFSVTVPANLSLTVSKTGEVYAATTAQIINNSTDAVQVSSISLTAENGWAIVPYATNMANAQVDAKLIGFKLNSAVSTASGNSENLILDSDWAIARNDALTLNYDAVVSATSDPISEQVITIVFVLRWA